MTREMWLLSMAVAFEAGRTAFVCRLPETANPHEKPLFKGESLWAAWRKGYRSARGQARFHATIARLARAREERRK